MRKLELLAPAKDLACGIAAVDCGADAVYIGAPKFGARVAAGNSIEDIAELVRYAHQYGAKVYVTLNTIIYDSELDDAFDMLSRINDVGVDAVLVQDMALNPDVSSRIEDCRLQWHASTQTDNRDREKVEWLHSIGFSRVVLARELSLEEIRTIHEACPDVELEAFVHGALCVSYSGACYASQYCFGRSANRGECAQFCRMKFDLIDGDGKELEHQRHLLSLKDMCQIDRLEDMADAGVVSFKIEGRLKNESYVKNVVAAYSQRLNELIAKRPKDYCRASFGNVHYAFEPNLKKTFNRGFTHYFLDGRRPNIFSPDTPKAIGEYVGKVKEIRGRSFNVAGTASFANGDGLCFINTQKELEGFRVNRVEGNRLFPLSMPSGLKPGTAVYRNNDEAFEKELGRVGTKRTVPVVMTLATTDGGFSLRMEADGYVSAVSSVEFAHQQAQKPQRENIIRQLSKLGDTIFVASEVRLEDGVDMCFIPSSILADLRREAVAKLKTFPAACVMRENATTGLMPQAKNVANRMAEAFYEDAGYEEVLPAYEVHPEVMTLPLMQCKHCLRYSFGQCLTRNSNTTWKEPLRLRLSDGRLFRLKFDCRNCQMNVLE